MAGAAVGLTATASVATPQWRASAHAQKHQKEAAALPDFGNPHGHAFVPRAGRAVSTAHSTHVIGNGKAASCTSAKVVKAVAKGGVITFKCGPHPVTIMMTRTARLMNASHQVVLDGGGKITLDGQGKRQILNLNTCAARPTVDHDCYTQQWPYLIVQNITLAHGYSPVQQTPNGLFGGGGGGAIFALGGRLKVVNSRFIGNRCYHYGPDLGGGAIRALSQWQNDPVYITKDTFRGGRCSNGSALSSIGTSWVVTNSVMFNNKAIGFGQNPAVTGTRGGGSGGAIYMDGDPITLTLSGTSMHDNYAREGGGAIFFVSDDNTGTLTIKNSTLHHNPSAVFWTRPYPGIYYHSSGAPTIINSTIN